MKGRIRLKLQSATPWPPAGSSDDLPRCPLCGRAIPPEQQDAHHLVPKSKGGKVTTLLHRICHRQIHALFTEKELAEHYGSAEMLLTHPDMQAFVRWVASKPDDFHERTRKSGRLKSR